MSGPDQWAHVYNYLVQEVTRQVETNCQWLKFLNVAITYLSTKLRRILSIFSLEGVARRAGVVTGRTLDGLGIISPARFGEAGRRQLPETSVCSSDTVSGRLDTDRAISM